MPFRQFSYFVILLLWCLPILALQWAVAGRALWRSRRVLAAAVLVCGTFLSLADRFAITRGIWQIHDSGTTGVRLLSHLPIEEALFYYLTAAMSAQGFLMLAFYFKPRGASF
jgi:15-cis-phytoene synthase/lycopene beta-cyclase